VGESIAYNFKLRMTENSSQMDGWNHLTTDYTNCYYYCYYYYYYYKPKLLQAV